MALNVVLGRLAERSVSMGRATAPPEQWPVLVTRGHAVARRVNISPWTSRNANGRRAIARLWTVNRTCTCSKHRIETWSVVTSTRCAISELPQAWPARGVRHSWRLPIVRLPCFCSQDMIGFCGYVPITSSHSAAAKIWRTPSPNPRLPCTC